MYNLVVKKMGSVFEDEKHYNDEKNSNSTPKLCLYNTFSSKTREPLGMLTPPLRSFASIPFKWEEVPGKPRTTAAAGGAASTESSSTTLLKSKTVRCLVPPPRLMSSNTSKVTNMPSPTTVLDGPYNIGRSASSSESRSFWSQEELGVDGKERVGSSSCRRGRSKRENKGKGITDISSVVENDEEKVKSTTIRKIKRRSNSFLNVSASSSKALASIYESFKQAFPWKRMPAERQRRKSS